MTLGELKQFIKDNNVSDDAEIYVDDGDYLHWKLEVSVDADGDIAAEIGDAI